MAERRHQHANQGPVLDGPSDDWTREALCAGGEHGEPELWYPKAVKSPVAYAEARHVCHQCPARPECLDFALALETGNGPAGRGGMWGGLDPSERYDEYRRRKTAS